MPINLEQVEAKAERQRARDQAEHMAAEIALGTALGCIKSLRQMGRNGALKYLAAALNMENEKEKEHGTDDTGRPRRA